MNSADRNERSAGAQASEQASHWWVVLHSENVSAADERAFSEWISRSPERVAAYLRTTMLMGGLASKDLRWPDTSSEVLIREASTAPSEPLVLSTMIARDAGQRLAAAANKRRLVPLTLAAAIVIATVATWLFVAGPQSYQTTLGEQRSVLLDDGSLVTLNTASKMEVDFSQGRRAIRLVAGEALFDVAHDAARPFEVESGRAVFRAVGTRFNVDRRSASLTTITVVEGRVAVIANGAGANSARAAAAPAAMKEGSASPRIGTADSIFDRASVVLTAAQRLTVTDSHLGAPETVANLAAATVWTQRRLIFERRPLAEVATEFNRYNRDIILIENEALKGEEVTGTFQANDTAAFMAFLAQIPGVRVQQTTDGRHIVVADEQSVGGQTR
ncbi:MAG: FecR family protein [Steroidobacteraceae bacterium]